MTDGLFDQPQHEFNEVSRYKYVSQNDDNIATASRRGTICRRGFILPIILLIAVLLSIWLVGAFIFIRQRFG